MIIIIYNLLFIFIFFSVIKTTEQNAIKFTKCSENQNICIKADNCPNFLICYETMLIPDKTRKWKFPERYSIPKKLNNNFCQECISQGICNGNKEKWHGLKVEKIGNSLQINADIFPLGHVLELKNILASEFIQFLGNDKSLFNKIVGASPVDTEFVKESKKTLVPLLKQYPGAIMLKLDILYGTGINHIVVNPWIIFNNECEKKTTKVKLTPKPTIAKTSKVKKATTKSTSTKTTVSTSLATTKKLQKTVTFTKKSLPTTLKTSTILTTPTTTPTTTKIIKTTPNPFCPSGYEYYQPNKYCIKLFHPNQKALSWNEANEKAKKFGARLASIHKEEEDDYIKNLINKQSGEGENVYWIGLHMDVIDGNIQNAKWTDNSDLVYGNPMNLKSNSKPYGSKTAINGNNTYVGISKDSDGKTAWGLYDKNTKGGYIWQVDSKVDVVYIDKYGLPSGYTCVNKCDPKWIELTEQNGQSAPINEGVEEENNCKIIVLSCQTPKPIAAIMFGSKGSVEAKEGSKTKVRTDIYCAREATTKKVGWLRNTANDNPRLFFFVEEAHCEEPRS